MLTAVARFEMRYLLRNPLLWITAFATLVHNFVSVSAGLQLGAEGGLLENAAYATLRNYLLVSIFFMLVTTAFVANAVVRDDDTGFGPIVRATRLGKIEYLLGRFLGAFAVSAACLLLVPVGILLGTLAPWANPATLGPNRIADHLYGYFLIALPNVLVHSAVFFALATATRSMMATYLGVVAFASANFVLEGALADRPGLVSIVSLADPFGARALADVTRYWTVPERNGRLPDFAGVLLYNRALWLGIAASCLAFALARFRVADEGVSRRKRRRLGSEGGSGGVGADRATADAVPALPSLPAPRHGRAATRTLLWLRTRFEARQVVLSPAFPVLLLWGMFTTLISLTTQRDPDGRPTYPTTLSMIPEIANGMYLVPLLVAVYYAGELVWRERDRRIHEIVDASPMPSWAYVVSKTLAMALVLVSLLLTSVVASMVVQLSLGFTELEIGKYLLWYVLPGTWDMLLLAALAVFVHALSPNKAVGWGVMAAFLAWQLKTSITHNLLLYGASPAMPLSDMNGAGSFWIGAWTFRAYWGAFAFLLLLASHLLWRRGTETRLRPRVALARRRLAGGPGRLAAAAGIVFVGTGAFAFYNTNVLNTLRTNAAAEARAADFERKYARYLDVPQPVVMAMTLEIELHPPERRAMTRGRYTLRNDTATPIEEVTLRTGSEDLVVAAATLDGARLARVDDEHGFRVFRLERPMLPNEERTLAFETRLELRGFRNQPSDTRLVENGTFLTEAQLLPRVNTGRAGTLQDSVLRRKYGLAPVPRTPRLEDVSATGRPAVGRGWAMSDITFSTSADQTPVAPGNRVSDVVKDGRRTARFVSSAPMHPRFSVQSARYAEKHRQHAGVDLVVYHHPAHAWNVDRMLDALAASLDYYRANFGPYPFDHARIVEFPGYSDFAQAFAGTIPYSENVGFVSDHESPDAMDYVTYLTAHELAHQYWAHQVVGADMEGRELLSETLSQYSAQMVVKRQRGADYMRRYLRYELDRYLEGREYTGGAEPTLVRVDGEDHVTYRKGALAMYLLQQRLGEDRVNRALRSLVERYRFKGAPYPRSLDLVEALRAQAATVEEQGLITDLFERVTLYHLESTGPTAVRRPDGRWDVSVPVIARKLYVDARGLETEAPLAEAIEIGLFTAEPGRDAFDRSHVLVLERRPVRAGAQTFLFTTDRRPTHAGIDPYNFYIDRSARDNVRPVR